MSTCSAVPGIRRIAMVAAVLCSSLLAGCNNASKAPPPVDDGQGSGPRHADATSIGRTESEARRSAIRAALAQLKSQYVDALVAVRDDQLVEDRVRIFASQSDVIAQTIDRRVLSNGAVEVTMRVWVDLPRGTQGVGRGEARPQESGNPGNGMEGVASSVADALDAEEENAAEASLTLADYIRAASAVCLRVQLFHADGRPFDVQSLATGEVRRVRSPAIAVPIVVRLSRSMTPRDLRASSQLRSALESSADRVVRNATELLSGDVLSGCPLSGREIWRGAASARGLVRPGLGQRSILVARRNDDRAGDVNWVQFDQYLLPAEMVPEDVLVPSAIVLALLDASGRIVGSERIPIAPASYLIDCERLTERLAAGTAATVEVGGRGARSVSFPFLSWGTHLESGARGEHLAVHAMALAPGTLAGGDTAFADELEIWAEVRLPRQLLATVTSARFEVETAPVRRTAR